MISNFPFTLLVCSVTPIIFLSCGCSSAPSNQVLVFPNNPYLAPSGPFHSVYFRIESLEPREEFIPNFTLQSGRENYKFTSKLKFQYLYNQFHIGNSRYPSRPRAVLNVFLEWEGPWYFFYRGQEIRVDGDSTWRPVVYYRPVYDDITSKQRQQEADENSDIPGYLKQKQSTKRLSSPKKSNKRTVVLNYEELFILNHEIIFRPDTPYWLINGKKIYPDPNNLIVLGISGDVEQVSR